MTILWCGGEDIDFTPLVANVTSAGKYRSDYARLGLTVYNVTYVYSQPFTPISSGWASVHYRTESSNGTAGYRMFGFCEAGSSKGFYLGVAAANKFGLYKFDGTTATLLVTEDGTSMSQSTLYRFGLNFTYGVAGELNFYLDGTLLISYSGDLTISGVTELGRVFFGAVGMFQTNYISEVIIADEDTRLLSLKTLAPNAAGDVNEWTGDYTAIDEVTLSDADVIHTDQFDKDFQCNLTGMPTGDFIVKAVKTSTRAADGIGGIGLKSGIKTNAAEHEPGVHLGSTVELDGSWQLIEELYQQNPITSNRFTPAEINALQLAYQSVEIV
jgi:hypothetical protein